MNFQLLKRVREPDTLKPGDYIRFIGLLLQGIALHAVEVNADDLSAFRLGIVNLSDRLNENTRAEELLLSIGGVNHSIKDYNQKVTERLKAHNRDLEAMLAIITNTITYLGKSSASGVNQLQVIQKTLEQASSCDDMRNIRDKLSDCLQVVRTERARLDNESAAQVMRMAEDVKHMKLTLAPESQSEAVMLDLVTGLPGRAAIELRVAKAFSEHLDEVLVILIVNELPSINGRYGRKVGDAMLRMTADHLAQRLPANTVLYRWSGPAFVIACNADRFDLSGQNRIRNIALTKLQLNLELNGKSLLLSVSFTSFVQKTAVYQTAGTVLEKLDTFCDRSYDPNVIGLK